MENKQENQGQNERAGLTKINAEISIKLSMTQSCHMRGWNKRVQSSGTVNATRDPVSKKKN